MRNKRAVVQTKLVCPKCGNKVEIFRKENKQKKFGHKKLLWCYKCKRMINHIEIKDEMIPYLETLDIKILGGKNG